MQLDKAIKTRRSIRDFSLKKPDWRKIIEAIDATRYTPMAGGNFTPRFIIINNLEKIQKIKQACQQEFIGTAQYVVIICSDPKRTLNLYNKKGETYIKQQNGAAIQNFLLEIHDKNLSACWIGHFVESQIKRILSIPKEINVEAIIPIGYQGNKSSIRKTKVDIDKILFFHKYGNNRMKEPVIPKR